MRKSLPVLCGVILLVACGGDGAGDSPTGGTGGEPLTPEAQQAVLCGNEPFAPPAPEPRASSFRECPRGDLGTRICDPGEACDFIEFDLLCIEPDDCESASQTGDLRCHRICEDGACAAGETCVERPVYVSDTPTRYIPMCLCESSSCEPPEQVAEGGLARWRVEEPMPDILSLYSAAYGAGRIYVSGGFASDGSTRERNTGVLVASVESDGTVSGWSTAGELSEPPYLHASVVTMGRLYVLGGQLDSDVGRELTSVVRSAPILENGRLGVWRAERALPTGRRSHAVLMAGGSLVVVGGALSEFGDETPDIWVAPVNEDGTIGAWTTIVGPLPLISPAATVALERLYVLDTRGVLHSSAVTDDPSRWEFREEPVPSWTGYPEFNRSLPNGRLVGLCDSLVMLMPGARAGTAPLDASGNVGVWRIATSAVDGPRGRFDAVAVEGSQVLVVGEAPMTRVGRVWSTRRQ